MYFDRSAQDVSEVKQLVTLQLSAVIDLDDGGQYLLQCGQECGHDYNDSTQDMGGTEHGGELLREVQGLCEQAGLELLPGMVDT